MSKKSFKTDINASEEMSNITFGGQSPSSGFINSLKQDQADFQANRVVRLPIGNIYPDLAQPRRAIPSSVRSKWDGNPENVWRMIEDWLTLAQKEWTEPTPVDFVAIFDGSPDAFRPEIPGPIMEAALDFLDLAISVRDEGLTNPITVAKIEDVYRIETGERRWMVFHFLHQWVDGESDNPQWDKIPARVMDKADVWRQAAENSQRTGLNAISRARQLSLLLMDLHGADDFERYEVVVGTGRSEQEFYAQVADGDEYAIPRGQSERILSATGLKSRQQLQQYRALLKLPSEIWVQADDENWGEWKCRDYIPKSTKANVSTTVDTTPKKDDIQPANVKTRSEYEDEHGLYNPQPSSPQSSAVTTSSVTTKTTSRETTESRTQAKAKTEAELLAQEIEDSKAEIKALWDDGELFLNGLETKVKQWAEQDLLDVIKAFDEMLSGLGEKLNGLANTAGLLADE